MRHQHYLLLLGVVAVLGTTRISAQQPAPTQEGAKPWRPNWAMLNMHPYPTWFSDAKLGIFVHWGLYSVPAYAGKEGYGEWLYKGLLSDNKPRKEMMALYADTTLPVREMYAQLTHHWHAELWDPQEWAHLFRRSGARYVMLVTKHHDGYSLWDDPYQPEWNSTVSGPRRNIVEELTAAVRAEGLRMGFYYSLAEWSHPLHRWTIDPDTAIDAYVEQYMRPQFLSLVGRYRPDAVFADGDWDFTSEQLRSEELIYWYYRLVGADAIVNDRWGRGTQHGFRTPEYSAGIADTTRPWAECRGIGRSFGLNRNEDLENYMTDRELIQHFCELVAHGGGLTLNVGPAADGHIPFIQQERLLALGHWLEVNGEAIYGSRPYHRLCDREQHSAPLPPSSRLDFDWVRNAPLKGMPVDHFRLEWQGDISVPADGDYTLRLRADDEATVRTADGDTLLHHRHDWAENPRAERTMHLDAGATLHLEVEYTERDLEATLRLEWSRDGGRTFEPIEGAWHGQAHWERTTRCFTRHGDDLYIIEFERPGQQLVIADMPRLPKGTRMQMLGCQADLRWKQQRDGRLLIDLRDVATAESNALDHAWVIKIAGGAR